MTQLKLIDVLPAAARLPDRAVLEIRGLKVSYPEHRGRRQVVHGIDLTLSAGEVLALVGESGSGKTTTAQAVIGLLTAGARIEGGSIRLNGRELVGLRDREMNHLRGAVVSLIPQDPGTSLNPLKTVGAQIGEILRLHGAVSRAGVRQAVLDLLDRVGLPDPKLRIDQYPHELSGGMRQRVLIAIAVALKPAVIIADEPTSALDVTVQKRILDLVDDLRAESGTAVLLVTHDLAIAVDRADRIVVLKDGRIQETATPGRLMAHPRTAYTRQLLSDAPALSQPVPRTGRRGGETIIRVENLVQDFNGGREHMPQRALDGIGFTVAEGTTHGIVGESGSGKTTAMRAVVGLLRPTSGHIEVAGQDVTRLSGPALHAFREQVQLVYQNPYASLDPRQTVREIIEEPLRNFAPLPRVERADRVEEILHRVALPAEMLSRRPAALSGGQRQRVAIARALVLKPRVVVLDEAVSALDVTVQAQVLRLLADLQRDLGLTYLFVSHDLSVIRAISDTVSVLRAGQLVESGPVEQVFTCPVADYTRDLIASIPGRKIGRPQLVSESSGT